MGNNDRSFGLLLAGVCAVIAAAGYLRHGTVSLGWIVAGLLLATCALAAARLLAPLRRAWIRLGAMMGHVVNPLVLGAVFLVVFLPVGGLMRLFGKDPMARGRDPGKTSYWLARTGDAAESDRLTEQF
jgi:hypothetical protein